MKILAFNLDMEQRLVLGRVAQAVNAIVREVGTVEHMTRLEDILKSAEKPVEARAIPAFPDEMLVFVDFEDEKLYDSLRLMREMNMRHIPLKATYTEYNRKWTPLELCMELRRENEEMEKYRKQKGK